MPQNYFEGFFDFLIRDHPINKFNGGRNILRLFDILPNFHSPQVKRSVVISNKNCHIQVVSQVTERRKTCACDLGRLENFRKILTLCSIMA